MSLVREILSVISDSPVGNESPQSKEKDTSHHTNSNNNNSSVKNFLGKVGFIGSSRDNVHKQNTSALIRKISSLSPVEKLPKDKVGYSEYFNFSFKNERALENQKQHFSWKIGEVSESKLKEISDILADVKRLIEFQKFLEERTATHFLHCWKDIESFKKDLAKLDPKADSEKISQIVTDINILYFDINSPYRIGIPEEAAEYISSKIQNWATYSIEVEIALKDVQMGILKILQNEFVDDFIQVTNQKKQPLSSSRNSEPKIEQPPRTDNNNIENDDIISDIQPKTSFRNVINKIKDMKIMIPKEKKENFLEGHKKELLEKKADEGSKAPSTSEQSVKASHNQIFYIEDTVIDPSEYEENEKLRRYVELFARKLITELLEPEEIERHRKVLRDFLKKATVRKYFADALSFNRSGSAIPHDVFKILAELIEEALVHCDLENDYVAAKNFLHMANTYFYCLENGQKEYVQVFLKHLPIWKKPRFWEFALYDEVAIERRKTNPKKFNQLPKEEQEEYYAREKAIFFGQLGSFGLHMLSMDLPLSYVEQFVQVQSYINGLDPEQLQNLLNTLPAMANAVEIHEQRRKASTVRIHSGTVVSQVVLERLNHRHSEDTIKTVLEQEREKVQEAEQCFQHNQYTTQNYREYLKEAIDRLESDTVSDLSLIHNEFNLLHKELEKKESECIRTIRQERKFQKSKLQEQIEWSDQYLKRLEGRLNETAHLRTLENSQSLGEQRLALQTQWERCMDMPKLIYKPNQIIVADHSYSLKTFQQQCALSQLSLQSTESHKWTITSYSQLKESFRDKFPKIESPPFTIAGLFWQIVFYPEGQNLAPTFTSLYLECLSFRDLNSGFSLDITFQAILKNQLIKGVHHQQVKKTHVFSPDVERAGYSRFLPISDFSPAQNGFLHNDTIQIEILFCSVHKTD